MINWRYRVRVVWLSIIYCFSLVGYLLVYGEANSELHSTIVTNMLILAGVIIGGYVFGVVTDNFVNGENDSISDHHEGETSSVGKDTKYGSWKSRRRLLFISLAWCFVVILYLTAWAQDNPLNRNIADGTIFLTGGIIVSYLFGVVFDKKSIQSTMGK